MILVDTCVISEVRHPNGNQAVYEAFSALPPDEVFFSVITIGEITAGISNVSGERAAILRRWLDGLLELYADRILPIDKDVAIHWGNLTSIQREAGRTLPVADGLIAATAKTHAMMVMTRDVRHFLNCGCRVNNPWDPDSHWP